jgi:hypothetical protein
MVLYYWVFAHGDMSSEDRIRLSPRPRIKLDHTLDRNPSLGTVHSIEFPFPFSLGHHRIEHSTNPNLPNFVELRGIRAVRLILPI